MRSGIGNSPSDPLYVAGAFGGGGGNGEVTLVDSDGNPIEFTGAFNDLAVRTGQFTRPADTAIYAAGDLIANSTTAASVVALVIDDVTRVAGEVFRMERARLRSSNPLARSIPFRLHFLNAAPIVAVGDNGGFTVSNALQIQDIGAHVGTIDVTPNVAGANGARGIGVPLTGPSISTIPTAVVEQVDGVDVLRLRLHVLVEVLAAYTPVAGEVFTVTVEGVRG